MFCRGEGQSGWSARPAPALRGYLPPPGKGPTLALSFPASPALSPVPGIQEMLNKHMCVERTKEQSNSGRITLTWNFPGSYEKNMISATLRSQCFALSDSTPINTPVLACLFLCEFPMAPDS